MAKHKKQHATQAETLALAQPALLERPFAVTELFERVGEIIEIEADEAERTAIAEDFGLEALLSLTARIVPAREGRVLHIGGTVSARLVQICGVTLEPFENTLEEPIDMRFSDDPKACAARADAAPGNEADWEDPPDPLPDGDLDLGLVVLEHLALGIDPYPRSPGATFAPEADTRGEASEEQVSPFEILRRLKLEQKN